jgi:phosphoglycolate phosphatase
LRHARPDVPSERYRELADRYRHHYFSSQDEIVLFDGTLEMLLALKARNHWLAVATGKTRRGLDQALAGSPLAGPVRRHPHRRRDARQARSADAGRAHPRARRGDRSHADGRRHHARPQLAANAGCASVAVSFGAHEHDEFASHQPLHVAHSTADLARWLDANA